MAEVGILVIFVLLLLLVFGERRRVAAAREARSAHAQLSEVVAALDLPADLPRDDFVKLVRSIQPLIREPDRATALAEARAAADELRRAATEMRDVVRVAGEGGDSGLGRRLEEQSFRQANQEGQLRRLEERLAATGLGKGERPCWVQPDGTIDYLFDVILTSRGIRLRERPNVARTRERELLPLPAFDPREAVSEATLLARTAALFEWSQQKHCRFFVVVYDGTQADEKVIYKSQLRAVEGHFYKRLDLGEPPF